MTIELKENERLDDLQRNGLQIIQKTDGFCFGMDAVLLSGFAAVKPGERVLDLGTGTGIIPLLLSAKTEGEHFSALEIQDEIARMAERSVKLNHLENKIEIVHGDIKEASRIFGAASFDVVTTNPPYMNDSHGLKNPTEVKAISRHEVLCTLEDVVREGAKVLKPGGKLAIITYHSIEDRMVKNFMRSGNIDGKVETDFFGRSQTPIRPVNNKVIVPTEEEVERNPRSRSAKLRVAEKI